MKNLQDIVRQFVKDNKLTSDPSFRALCLSEEIGELCKEILKSTGYGSREFKATDEFYKEVGDVLFAIICIANAGDVDMESALKNTIQKMTKRIKEKGHPGSRE